jgi:hypothetical protein
MFDSLKNLTANSRRIKASEIADLAETVERIVRGLQGAGGMHGFIGGKSFVLGAADGGLYSPDNSAALTYTGEHSEAVSTGGSAGTWAGYGDIATAWDRRQPKTYQGADVTICTGVCYDESGDEKLYAYLCDLKIDTLGRIVSIGAERRVEVDAPDDC